MSGTLATTGQAVGDSSFNFDVFDPSRYLVAGQPSAELCFAALLLGLISLAWALPELREAGRRIESRDGWWLLAWSAIGLGLRLLGGVRIPAYPNSNGFNMLNNLLASGTNFGNYGNAPDALFTLVFSVLPRSERTVVVVQLLLSTALVPLCYAVWRSWSGSVQGARWSAAVAAVLPAQVYFGTTEEVLVPATFFLMLAWMSLGLGVRLRVGALLLASIFLAAFAAQFRVNLLIAPPLLLLFVLASGQARALARQPMAWLAALLLCALLATSVLHLLDLLTVKGLPRDNRIGIQFEALVAPDRLLRPMTCATCGEVGNAFLAPCMVPPTLTALALVGVVAWRRSGAVVLATLAAALVLTLTGLVAAYMNTVRLQLPAQPFYALLAGEGLAATLALLGGKLDLSPWRRDLAGSALIAASVALWPGPTGQLFAPQLERRVVLDAMATLPDSCTIVYADVGSPPSYLSADQDRHHTWVKSSRVKDLPRAVGSGCWLYFRSHRCSTVRPKSPGAPDLAASCATLERQLQVKPLFVRAILASSDNVDAFSAPQVNVGFYRVNAPAAAATATAAAPATDR